MTELVLICQRCEREIPSSDKVRSTPEGEVICDRCAVNGFVDVPFC
jgi:hypothetical protein